MEWLKCLDKFNKTVRFILTWPILLLDFIWCHLQTFCNAYGFKMRVFTGCSPFRDQFFLLEHIKQKNLYLHFWKKLATLFLARHLKPMDLKYQARICRNLGCVSVVKDYFCQLILLFSLFLLLFISFTTLFWYYS